MQISKISIPFYDECKKHIKISSLPDLEKFFTSHDLEDLLIITKEFANEIFKNQLKYICNESLKINMTYSNKLEQQKFISQVKSFVYYRLYYYIQYLAQRSSQVILVFDMFMIAMEKIEKNELFIPLLLHESRGLIDDSLSGERSANYLSLSMNMEIVQQDPNDQLQQDYRDGVLFFRSTLKTSLVFKCLEEFLTSIDIENVTQETIEKSLFILQNIEFVLIRGVCFVAMNGVNNKIYFNIDMLEKSSSKFNKARVLGNCYHEGGHYLLRKLKEDFGTITPRQNDLESLEAGFRMEEILFGNYQKMYWILFDDMLNEKLWNDESKPLPLLEHHRLLTLPSRSYSNPYRSGCEEFIYVGFE